MKKYTIAELHLRYIQLKEKKMKKESWNKEAVSYDINLERISIAAAAKLAATTELLPDERSLLMQMVNYK